MTSLLVIILGSATPVIASTNTLLFPIKKYQKFIIFLYVLFIYYFLGVKIGQWITPIVIIGMMVFIAVFNRKKAVLNICSALLGYLCAVVLNHCFTIFLSFLGLTITKIATNYPIPFNFTFTFSAYLFTYFFGKIAKKKWGKNQIEFSSGKLYLLLAEECICLAIFSLNIIYGEFLGYSPEVININGILFFLFFIHFALIIFLYIRIDNKEKSVELLNKKFEITQEDRRKTQIIYMDVQRFQENLYSMLSVMHSYIKSGDLAGYELFYNDSISPMSKKINYQNTTLSKLSYIQIVEIKDLFKTKFVYAIQRGVNIEIDIIESFQIVNMDLLSLKKVLEIFLDNAIEAAEDSIKKIIYLRIAKEENCILIEIKNSCNNLIDLKFIDKFGVSSKSNERGVGLYQAKKILEKYPNIIQTVKCEKGLFSQILEL